MDEEPKTQPQSGFKPLGALKTRMALTILGFVAVNLAVYGWLGPNSSPLNPATFALGNLSSPMYGTWTWWMVREFVKQEKQADVALVGSSLINSPSWAADAHVTGKSLDCLEHRQVITLERLLDASKTVPTGVRVINCAMQGGFASDYYMLERTLFQGEHKPKLVVIGVSPRDFLDNNLQSASATEPFRFFSRYVDAGRMSQLAYADSSSFFHAIDNAMSRLPIRRLSDIFNAKVAATSTAEKTEQEKQGNELALAISNGHQQVKLGQWIVPPNMKDTWIDNTEEYRKRYQNPKAASYPTQVSFFKETLKDLVAKGCTVLVVGMPTQHCNRVLLPEQFWNDYRDNMAAVCRETDCKWVDMSGDRSFRHSDYLDTVHLNDKGGIKFFSKLSAIICGDKRAVASLGQNQSIASDGRTY